jgi:NAD-dependent dihydropyrimidine dehydrogenase PreA subunit
VAAATISGGRPNDHGSSIAADSTLIGRPGRPARTARAGATSEAGVASVYHRSAVTYVITEPCIGVKDGSCVDVCPVDCIHTTDNDTMFFIDPDECIDCGACEPECPVTAIFAEDAVPEQWTNYIQINADYFKAK